MTNSPGVAAALNPQCAGIRGWCSRPRGGRHELCSGKVACDAQVYPRGLCGAVLKGISYQMRADGLLKNGCYGVQVADDELAVLEAMYGVEQGYSGVAGACRCFGALLTGSLPGRPALRHICRPPPPPPWHLEPRPRNEFNAKMVAPSLLSQFRTR